MNKKSSKIALLSYLDKELSDNDSIKIKDSLLYDEQGSDFLAQMFFLSEDYKSNYEVEEICHHVKSKIFDDCFELLDKKAELQKKHSASDKLRDLFIRIKMIIESQRYESLALGATLLLLFFICSPKEKENTFQEFEPGIKEYLSLSTEEN